MRQSGSAMRPLLFASADISPPVTNWHNHVRSKTEADVIVEGPCLAQRSSDEVLLSTCDCRIVVGGSHVLQSARDSNGNAHDSIALPARRPVA